jgi:hypothetical protein
MVGFFDEVSARAEEKKFELSSEQRAEIDAMLGPYHDGYREKMLGELAIAERRQIEEEAGRRREEE